MPSIALEAELTCMRQRSSWSVRAIGSAQFQWCWTHGRGQHTVIDRMTGRRRNKFDAAVGIRSEERREGKECVRTFRSRWWTYYLSNTYVEQDPTQINNYIQ